MLFAASPLPVEAQSAFATFGYDVTGGAAPGYIEDAACQVCHRDLYNSYQEVGMARSFAEPRRAEVIEDYENNVYFHGPSRRFYQMRRSDAGDLTFKRWQVDAEGTERNVFETPVEWILGSGHTSRVYLYRTPNGELYQLPLAWYTQGQGWGMAPGFDNDSHLGLKRRIRRECMFCHNAYPDVPAGSDLPGEPHLFPAELPEGTGCQRCHGPGAEHVALAFAGEMDEAKLHGSITNPGKLEPARRNDVCYGCHLQPTVELMGVRRFERADYSFRPGEKLDDYIVLMDTRAEGENRDERFEINHHPYRLEQSRCFVESAGELSCLSCHDPHRKVPVAERAAHYRSACLECHETSALSRPLHAEPDTLDCADCHMPRRRTRDVIHVTMTDHKIAKGPFGPELTAPKVETDPVLVEMEFYRPDAAPDGALGEAYKAVAVLQAGSNPSAVDHLKRQLQKLDLKEPAPWLQLLKFQLRMDRHEDVERTATDLYSFSPQPLALQWWALSKARQGEYALAEALLRQVVEKRPDTPEVHYNLGLVSKAGLPHLRRAVELRPTFALAWLHLGHRLETREEAIEAYTRALALDPSLDSAYLALAERLAEREDGLGDARSLLRHGVENVAEPEPLVRLLEAQADPH